MNTILDGELIRSRRLELGLSQRELARRIRISPTALLKIERGGNHHALLLRIVVDLAMELSMHPTELFIGHRASEAPTPDDVTLEAALISVRGDRSTFHLAEALGWRHKRVEDAISTLQARLDGTGMSLVRTLKGVQLRPRPGVLTVEMPASQLARRAAYGRPVSITEARLLQTALEKKILGYRTLNTNPRRVAVASLLKRGYLEKRADGYALAPVVAKTFEAAVRTSRRSRVGQPSRTVR